MKIEGAFKPDVFLTLQILTFLLIFSSTSYADQILSRENKKFYINAPNTGIDVTVKDEGEDTVRLDDKYIEFYVKGWVCDRDYTKDTTLIIARLNMATSCYVKDSVEGSLYRTFEQIEKDALVLAREIIERAKKGYADTFQITGPSSSLEGVYIQSGRPEMDFGRERRIAPALDSSDPENYTAVLKQVHCYTESDIKKLMEARMDAANLLIASWENWKKKREEKIKKPSEK